MKPAALGLLIAAASFGVGTLYLSMQLHEERARSDQLAAQTRALNTRIAELEKARSERLFVTANPLAGAAMPPDGPPMAQPPNVEGATGADADFDGGNEELDNKMKRSQIRAKHRRMNADFGAQLGLNKEQINKLIDLLTDQELEAMKSSDDAVSVEAPWRLYEERHRKEKAQIAELIGADKAAAFDEYRESLPARQDMEALAFHLDGADVSLSDAQRKRVLAVFVEERNRVPGPEMADAASIDAYASAYSTWQDDYNERVVSQVRPLLNSEQLAIYDEYQGWYQQMRAQIKTVRAERARRYSATAPAPVPAEKPRK